MASRLLALPTCCDCLCSARRSAQGPVSIPGADLISYFPQPADSLATYGLGFVEVTRVQREASALGQDLAAPQSSPIVSNGAVLSPNRCLASSDRTGQTIEAPRMWRRGRSPSVTLFLTQPHDSRPHRQGIATCWRKPTPVARPSRCLAGTVGADAPMFVEACRMCSYQISQILPSPPRVGRAPVFCGQNPRLLL